jgi:hypothetical protein
MSAALRRLSFFVFLVLAGCGTSVREDRAIPFTTDGGHVAFQHGRDGIFVAEKEGAEPTRIFQPDTDVIAISPPLWSPIDKRLIFTTAKSDDKKDGQPDGLPVEPEPEGNLYQARPIQYTCWLHSKDNAEKLQNVPLFTVCCGHPGYVAANLAVRWHPDGQHILYIKQDENGRYGLHAFNVQTAASHQVFPHSGDELIFDWAPDQTHLVCMLSDKVEGANKAGIWIGKPDADHWWHGHLQDSDGRRETADQL